MDFNYSPQDEAFRKELREWLTANKASVMPTRELEMFGMAAVEAQACGKPVVASDGGGLKETVPDGVGIRFTPNSADALQDALTQMLASSEQLRCMGLAAKRNASKYDWPLVAKAAERTYSLAASLRSRRSLL